MEIMLVDNFEDTLKPILSLKPAFALKTGIFSDLERGIKKGGGRFKIFINPDNRLRDENFYRNFLKSANPEIPVSFQSAENNALITPDTLLSGFSKILESDISFLNREIFSATPMNFEGNLSNIWIHKNAKVSNLCFINASQGPVVIDDNVQISAFSILNGPLYIGPGCALDKVMISKSRVGYSCRLAGEISDSIIGDFTNKHHEGFLGHSIAGDWANLGALTTTSDLKNNYGEIRLDYAGKKYDTHRIKFGSIIGDYVKTGIGTMLNTGTILDVGTLLYSGYPVQKYYAPFFWGGANVQRYKLDRFLADIEKIMARRNQKPDPFVINQLTGLYNL